MNGIFFRKCNLEDWVILQQISLETFSHTYKHKNSKANFENYTSKAFHSAQLQKELQNTNSEFYFVEKNKSVVGYLKLNTLDAQTEKYDAQHLEIERIYLQTTYQQQGIGQQMIDFSIQRAKALNKTIVWLGVWKQNPDAIRFYKKQGFSEYGTHFFLFGDEAQVDFLLKRNI